jgi:hypothetical protein
MPRGNEGSVDEPFELSITDVFFIRGRGTVVTGRVARGVVRTGDLIQVHGPSGVRSGTVDGIETFRQVLDEATAGEDIGLRLGGDAANGVAVGDVVSSPGAKSAVPPQAPEPVRARSARVSAPSPPLSAASRRDPRFDEAEAEYRRLRDQLDHGAIGPQDLDAALNRIVFDLGGRYWMIGANSGRWYVSEGDRWVEADPPTER